MVSCLKQQPAAASRVEKITMNTVDAQKTLKAQLSNCAIEVFDVSRLRVKDIYTSFDLDGLPIAFPIAYEISSCLISLLLSFCCDSSSNSISSISGHEQ